MTRLVSLSLAAVLLVAGGCPAAPKTVHYVGRGTLLTLDGQPVGGARVRVTGCDDQYSIGDGTFLVGCAPAAYDVAVEYGSLFGVAYVGLTRRDPVLRLPFSLPPTYTATVSGTPAPRTASTVATVALASPQFSADVPDSAWISGAYTLEPSWFEPGPLAATIHALEWTPDGTTGLPAAYTGYGSVTLSIASGGAPTASPTLAPVGSGTGSVTTDVSNAGIALWISWPGGGATELVAGTATGTSSPLIRPGIIGAKYAVLASSGTNPQAMAWQRGLSADGTHSLVLPTAPSFTAPASGSSADLTTNFTFGALVDAVYVVSFEPDAGGTRSRFLVVTASTTVKIPDFTWAGLTPTAASNYTARVRAVGPFVDVDEAAGPTGGLLVHPHFWNGAAANEIPATDGFASNATLAFTTP